MDDLSEILRQMELQKMEMLHWPFSLGSELPMENPQPDKSDAWQYTRYGFLFAWCVEQDAFSESPDSIEFMESVELIEKI